MAEKRSRSEDLRRSIFEAKNSDMFPRIVLWRAATSKRIVVPSNKLLLAMTRFAKVETDSELIIFELTRMMLFSQRGSRKCLRISVINMGKVKSTTWNLSLCILIKLSISESFQQVR